MGRPLGIARLPALLAVRPLALGVLTPRGERHSFQLVGRFRLVQLWLGAFVFLGAGSAAAAPKWQAPVEVAPPGVPGSSLLFQLAVDRRGDALLGFSLPTGICDTANDCPAEMFVRSRPSGDDWRPPVALGGHEHGAYMRDLVTNADGRGAMSGELGNFFRPFGRVLARSEGPGSDWHPLEPPWALDFPNRHVVLRSDERGDLFVLWQDGRRLWLTTRSVTAAGWELPAMLSETADLFSGRLEVGPNGDALAYWTEKGETIVGAIRPALSSGWAPPAPIEAAGPILAAAVDARGNMILIERGTSGVYARSRPVAAFWQSPVILSEAPQLPWSVFGVSVSFDAAGTAVATWSADQPRAGAAWPRVVGVVRDRLRGWQAPRFVSPVGEWANFPRLAVDPSGRSVVVWDFNKPGGYGVHAALRSPGSPRWTAPVELDPSQSAWSAHVGIDARGHALAAWERYRPDGPPGALMASDLIDNGPLIRKVAMARKIVAGVRTRFLVAVDSWLASPASAPRWRFGDGGTARGSNVVHVYRRPGAYRLSVTARDDSGANHSVRRRVVVRP
jgi:hypothetical protein